MAMSEAGEAAGDEDAAVGGPGPPWLSVPLPAGPPWLPLEEPTDPLFRTLADGTAHALRELMLSYFEPGWVPPLLDERRCARP